MKYCIIITKVLLLLNICIVQASEEWIDPHDMGSSVLPYAGKQQICDDQYKVYLRRTINLILNTVYKEEAASESYDRFEGHLLIDIDMKNFNTLKNFADGNEENLQVIDKILSDILVKPSTFYMEEYLKSWMTHFLAYLTSRTGIMFTCGLAYVFVIYKIMHLFSSAYFVKFVVSNLILIDFVFTWFDLYQKAEIDKMVKVMKFKEIPVDCNVGKMNLWNFVSSAFYSGDKCKEYYEVMYYDIFLKISPLTVLIEMATRLITNPASAIGKAVGDLSREITNSFPWWIGYGVLPGLLLFVLLMTCILLSFILGVPLKFNFFHFISFQFGTTTSSNEGNNMISHKSVEKLLELAAGNRNRIEEVREDTGSSSSATATVKDKNLQQCTQKKDEIPEFSSDDKSKLLLNETEKECKSITEKEESDEENTKMRGSGDN